VNADDDREDAPSISAACVKCGTEMEATYTQEEAGQRITLQETHRRPDNDQLCYGTVVVMLPPWD
jgi:hypothetical protein